MKILLVYLAICFLWSWFAVYKQHQYPLKSTFWKYLIIYFFNFIIFPYCLFLAIRDKKMTFKNTYKHKK